MSSSTRVFAIDGYSLDLRGERGFFNSFSCVMGIPAPPFFERDANAKLNWAYHSGARFRSVFLFSTHYK
jgi:hypothetical protein